MNGLFEALQIPPGSILAYAQNPNILCGVVDESLVSYDGRNFTLDALTQHVRDTSEPVDGMRAWTYCGERLTDRRHRIEREKDD